MFFANYPRMSFAMYLYFVPLAATVRFFTFVCLIFIAFLILDLPWQYGLFAAPVTGREKMWCRWCVGKTCLRIAGFINVLICAMKARSLANARFVLYIVVESDLIKAWGSLTLFGRCSKTALCLTNPFAFVEVFCRSRFASRPCA